MPYVRPSAEKPSAALGAILIVLLLAAIVLGGLAVWRGYENAKWTRPTTAAAPAAVEQTAEQDNAAEPSVPQIPAQEDFPPGRSPDTVTLMALGDNLIHNTVYWSAETEDGGYDFTPFYADIQPTVQSYDIACINQETIFVKDHAMLSNYPAFAARQRSATRWPRRASTSSPARRTTVTTSWTPAFSTRVLFGVRIIRTSPSLASTTARTMQIRSASWRKTTSKSQC